MSVTVKLFIPVSIKSDVLVLLLTDLLASCQRLSQKAADKLKEFEKQASQQQN